MMNVWEAVGRIFKRGTYFPNNVNKKRGVGELVIDCKK